MSQLDGPMEPLWVAKHWPRVEPLLRKLVEQDPANGFTVQGLSQVIQAQSHRVWIYGDFRAILMTHFRQLMSGELVMCLGWAAGEGVLDAIESEYPLFERYARAHGARHIEILGRPGWERAMSSKGFSSWSRTIKKEL